MSRRKYTPWSLSSLLYLIELLLAGTAEARVQQFQSSWEKSRWQVEAAPQRCTMTHDIPRFGRARFEQKSGQRLQFSLLVDQPPVKDGKARIHVEALPWAHGQSGRLLGDFSLHKGKTPLEVPREQALRIYDELENGMKPVIEFSDWGDASDDVQVSLLPVRFREALPEFLNCTAGLLYLDFEPVAERTVLFATDSSGLSRATRRVLEDVAREYRKQRDFRIVLGGHADERGSHGYNMELSRQRAEMVARYLHSRGVPSKVIDTRYFGASEPKDSASGEKAWARNRRVTVWLASG